MLSFGCRAHVYHRDLKQGFYSTVLGEQDGLRVVLQANPSTGYTWEALFNDEVIAMKDSACTPPADGKVGLTPPPSLSDSPKLFLQFMFLRVVCVWGRCPV